MIRIISFILLCSFFSLKSLYCQRNCGTQEYLKNTLNSYPELQGRYGIIQSQEETNKLNVVITIPVVVHILYKTANENISDFQINSQVRTLNEDFKGTNRDAAYTPAAFQKYKAGDCKIEFRINKIIRQQTNVDIFFCDIYNHPNNPFKYSDEREPIKFIGKGGSNALPCDQFLNLWVGNITDGTANQLLGYSSQPGAPCNFDGVVIFYKNFGLINCTQHYDKGRTVTHEVGHWLGLKHIWGDANCGDDLIADTPPQADHNFYCPTFRKVSPGCSTTSDGDMFMNFMDYVYDECMYMFTEGQKVAMRSTFSKRNFRSSMLYSNSFNIESFHAFIGELKSEFSPFVDAFEEVHKESFFDYVEIRWKSANVPANYTINLKLVKDREYKTFTTDKNHLKIYGLVPGALYEVTLKGNFKDIASPEGLPFLFVVSGKEKRKEISFN